MTTSTAGKDATVVLLRFSEWFELTGMPLLKSWLARLRLQSKARQITPIISAPPRAWLWGLGLALALGGCSALRLSYNNAPTLLYWWLDGYADFDKSQGTQTRSELNKLVDWHRKEELPLIADLLESAQSMASGNITGPQVCELYEKTMVRMDALSERVLPSAAAIVPTLTQAQLDFMAKAFEKKTKKWREDYRRADKFTERTEDFYGTLSSPQLQQLQAALHQTKEEENLYFAEVTRRQKLGLSTLTGLQKADPATALNALKAWNAQWQHSSDVVYQDFKIRSTAQTCKALAQLHNSASPKQRKKLIATLQSYQQEAMLLHRETI